MSDTWKGKTYALVTHFHLRDVSLKLLALFKKMENLFLIGEYLLHNVVLVSAIHQRESLQKVLVAQSCPTLCDPTDCSPPASYVHRILHTRTLEWVAISFSRGSYQPRA